MRWCWVNFQCRGRPTIWITVGQGPTAPAVGAVGVVCKLPGPGRPTTSMTVGQGPTALAVSAGGRCLDIFTLSFLLFLPHGRACQGVLLIWKE